MRENIRYRAKHAPHLLRHRLSEIEHSMRATLWGPEYLANPKAGKWRLNHDL